MTTGLNATVANGLLNALARGTNYTAPVAFFVKVHTGDPGAAGTANAAGNTTRVSVTFGSAASAGAIASTVDANWTSVSTSETYTHVSVWDAVTAGNFVGSTVLTTSRAVLSGDNFTLSSGLVTLSLTPLAA